MLYNRRFFSITIVFGSPFSCSFRVLLDFTINWLVLISSEDFRISYGAYQLFFIATTRGIVVVVAAAFFNLQFKSVENDPNFQLFQPDPSDNQLLIEK